MGKETKKAIKIFLGIFFGIISLILILSSITVIPAGEVGVRVLFGNVKEGTLQSGFHIKNPFLRIVKMDTRTQIYTMVGTPEEGAIKGDDTMSALTSDGLSVGMDLTIRYHLMQEKAPEVYENIGRDYVEKIIRPSSRTAIRVAAVNFTATDIYSTKREEVILAIEKELMEDFEDKGVILEKVQLRNVTLPTRVTDAIEKKLQADQEAQQMEFVLIKAEKEAEVKIVEANGLAEAQRIINTSLTDRYLQHEAIQAQSKMADSPNHTQVYIPVGNNGIPLVKMIE